MATWKRTKPMRDLMHDAEIKQRNNNFYRDSFFHLCRIRYVAVPKVKTKKQLMFEQMVTNFYKTKDPQNEKQDYAQWRVYLYENVGK